MVITVRGGALVGAQIGMVGLLLAGMAVMPPAKGDILLLPIRPMAAQGLAREAVAAGAMLVGRGPVAGALIVRGERSRLAQALMPQGILPLAAGDRLCGNKETSR